MVSDYGYDVSTDGKSKSTSATITAIRALAAAAMNYLKIMFNFVVYGRKKT